MNMNLIKHVTEMHSYSFDELQNCTEESLKAILNTYISYSSCMKPMEDKMTTAVLNMTIDVTSYHQILDEICVEVATFKERVGSKHAIISKDDDNEYYLVYMSVTLDKDLLVPGASVGVDMNSMAIVSVFPSTTESCIKLLDNDEKSNVTFDDIGGLEEQKRQIKEVVELSLNHPELFTQVGIDVPKGILMHGAPGCGKTLIAKAIANETNASFFRFNGSDFVEKYLGDGPKKMRDVFAMAKEHAPSIIFIDEIDAIAEKRNNNKSDNKADAEVHRILN